MDCSDNYTVDTVHCGTPIARLPVCRAVRRDMTAHRRAMSLYALCLPSVQPVASLCHAAISPSPCLPAFMSRTHNMFFQKRIFIIVHFTLKHEGFIHSTGPGLPTSGGKSLPYPAEAHHGSLSGQSARRQKRLPCRRICSLTFCGR